MATRATYTWIPYGAKAETFYIHYDGYPEGAVLYMESAMHRAYKYHTNPLEEFRKFAEPSSKDEHGDTEYHYTMYFPKGSSRLHVKWEHRTCGGEWKVMGNLAYGEFYRRFYNEV